MAMSLGKLVYRKTSRAFKDELDEFLGAARKIGSYSLMGCILGLVLVYISKNHTGDHSLWSMLMEHLGVGLMVAAIAVFIYEYKAHAKGALRLSERLADILGSQSEVALQEAVAHLFEGSKRADSATKEQQAACIQAIKALAALSNPETEAVDRFYQKFLTGLLSEIVLENAKRIVRFKESKVAELHFPSTASEIVDRILAEQLQLLQKGDRYDVMTNLGTWRIPLTRLHAATRISCGMGVSVRRVFVLDTRLPPDLTVEGARRILKSHGDPRRRWQRFFTTNKYEVKLLGPQELLACRNDGHAITDEALGRAIGIFTLGGETHIRFRVNRADLSRVEISGTRDDLEDAIDIFNVIWRYAVDLTPSRIERVLSDLVKDAV